jgi:hypothetical protein
MTRFPAYLVALLAMAATVQGQSPGETTVAKNIYATIVAAAETRTSVPLLLDPSLPINTDSGHSQAAQLVLDTLVDSLPLPQWVFSPNRASLRETLASIADSAEFSPAESRAADALTADEQALLYLDQNPSRPTDEYRTLLDLTKRLKDADRALKAEKDPRQRAQLELERADATLRLTALPHLDELRRVARKAAAPNGAHHQASRKNLRDSIAGYQRPTFTPAFERWPDSSGWVRLDVSLNTGANVPEFAAGPPGLNRASWAPAAVQRLAGNNATAISLEIKRIFVSRPSLDLSFVTAPGWTMADGSLLSDGQLLTDGKRPAGRMPLLISAILLARNISIKTRLAKSTQLALLGAAADSRLKFGPLSLGGEYSVPPGNLRFFPALGSRGLASPEMQVIAVFCDQVPLSPAPNIAPRH